MCLGVNNSVSRDLWGGAPSVGGWGPGEFDYLPPGVWMSHPGGRALGGGTEVREGPL